MASTSVVVAEFDETVAGPDGRAFTARACGRARDDGLWEGWIEFLPVGGGAALRTRRETTQPGLDELAYWAGGLSDIYLSGALDRALMPPVHREPRPVSRPAFEGPAPDVATAAADLRPHAILDPFAVHAQGEEILRRELGALEAAHLVGIIRAFELSDEPASTLERMDHGALARMIVERVRARIAAAARPPAAPELGEGR
jgi:hypothetical protein